MSAPFEENKDIELLEEEESFEDSTVFSDPEEKHDKIKKPGLWKKVLLGFAVLVILGGAIFGIVTLIDIMSEEETAPTVEEFFLLARFEAERESTYNDETVVSKYIDYELVSKVQVKTEKLTLNMTSERAEEATVSTWYEDSMPKEYTSTASVGMVAKSALDVKYTRIIADEIKDGVDYGFEKPTYSVTVTPKEGEAFVITVGKQSADKSGYYVTVSDDPKVYFVTNKYVTKLEVEDIMELSKAMRVPAFSSVEGSAEYYFQGTLSKFDYMYFKNNNIDKTFKFETVSGDAGYEYNTFKIVEPMKRLANDIGIEPIIELFSNGIDSGGLYCFTKTDEDLKKFGLDNPDLYVSLKAGKQERTVIAKLQPDGNYALVVSDMDVILNTKAANLSPVNLKQKNLYSVFFFIENLRTIEEFVIESGVTKHTFGIVTKPSEKDEGQLDIAGVKINGAEASSPEEFQSYYQFVLGITAVSYAESDISGKSPSATITLKKTGDAKDVVIEYYEVENGRYQVVVDGSQQGLIGSSSFKNIVKYASNVAAGKVYNS